jgi:hypothetical protein
MTKVKMSSMYILFGIALLSLMHLADAENLTDWNPGDGGSTATFPTTTYTNFSLILQPETIKEMRPIGLQPVKSVVDFALPTHNVVILCLVILDTVT